MQDRCACAHDLRPVRAREACLGRPERTQPGFPFHNPRDPPGTSTYLKNIYFKPFLKVNPLSEPIYIILFSIKIVTPQNQGVH